jgi:hypothetical protein
MSRPIQIRWYIYIRSVFVSDFCDGPQLAVYYWSVLQIAVTNSFLALRGLMNKIVARDKDIMRFAAMNEIILMPCVVFMLFR